MCRQKMYPSNFAKYLIDDIFQENLTNAFKIAIVCLNTATASASSGHLKFLPLRSMDHRIDLEKTYAMV